MTVNRCKSAAIYNPTSWCHTEEDGIPFEYGSSKVSSSCHLRRIILVAVCSFDMFSGLHVDFRKKFFLICLQMKTSI